MAETSTVDQAWNQLIAGLPGRHLLQTWQWGQVKSRYGWQPESLVWDAAGKFHIIKSVENNLPGVISPVKGAALTLKRQIRIPLFPSDFNMLYIPKGPLIDWADTTLRQQVLDDLQAYAKQQGSIFIKVDPDVRLFHGVPGEPGWQADETGSDVQAELTRRSWRFSNEQVQFRNTVLVDLSGSDEQLMQRMKQKTRYNIRLAGRKGVTIRQGGLSDLEQLYNMYAETSLRDGFVIRDRSYYLDIWQTFIKDGLAEPLIAEVEGQPVAGLFLFAFAERAWYIYGMSTEQHRDKMPNYLLQWTAMQRARAKGCTVYDLWGAPDEFTEADPLWGVYRFKEGLGGEVVGHIGAWDLPVRKQVYFLYTWLMPRILGIMRSRGKIRTQRMMSV